MSKRVDLLKGHITKSLAKLAIPLMGMSFLQMAYNLTDIFWIGKLGSGAVAAIGTGGLLIWLCTGLHSLAQTGGQVLVGQSLGAKDFEKAGKFAHSALFISVVINVIMGLSFIIFTKQIIGFFHLNDAEVIAQAETYIKVTGGLIIFMLMSKLLTGLLTTTGDSKTPLIATTIGLVFNMVLDPIFIFGLGIIPKMGVLGAGLATVLAQIIVFLILASHAIKDKHLFQHVNMKKAPDFSYCKRILKLSFPTTLQQTAFPLISMYISRLVAGFSDDAVAVQRVGSQIESISWMTTEGFAVAVNSFISQNYGAGNIARAKEGFFKSMAILGAFGIMSTLLLTVFPKQIFGIFLSEPDVLKMGTEYLAIIGASQLFMCVEILSISAMNAFSQTRLPAVISISFMLIRLPLATFLSQTSLGLNGIWIAIAFSTVLKGSFLLVAILVYLRKVKPIEI